MKYSKLLRKESAKKRQDKYDSLTTKQKIDKLDKLFGEGSGVSKQRTKLNIILEKELKNDIKKEAKSNKKPYQKPKKS